MNIPAYNTAQDPILYQDELSQSLVGGLSDSGWTPPVQTTEQISQSQVSNPAFWINSDTNQVIFKMTDGNLYSVDMTPFVP